MIDLGSCRHPERFKIPPISPLPQVFGTPGVPKKKKKNPLPLPGVFFFSLRLLRSLRYKPE